jgi:hypothetical protein
MRPVAGMHPHHVSGRRELPGVRIGPAQHLAPVGSEPFGVLRMQARMAERMLGLGVGEAAMVPRVGESEHHRGTAGGLLDTELLTGRRGHGKNAIADRPARSRCVRIVRRRLIATLTCPSTPRPSPAPAAAPPVRPPKITTATQARLRVARHRIRRTRLTNHNGQTGPLEFGRLLSDTHPSARNAGVSSARVPTPPHRPQRSRRRPTLGARIWAKASAARATPSPRRFQWMPAGPVPFFWREPVAGASSRAT